MLICGDERFAAALEQEPRLARIHLLDLKQGGRLLHSAELHAKYMEEEEPNGVVDGAALHFRAELLLVLCRRRVGHRRLTVQSLLVFDHRLQHLWTVSVRSDGLEHPRSTAQFLGADTLLTAEGRVYSWRRERRFLRPIDHSTLARLHAKNPRSSAPCSSDCDIFLLNGCIWRKRK